MTAAAEFQRAAESVARGVAGLPGVRTVLVAVAGDDGCGAQMVVGPGAAGLAEFHAAVAQLTDAAARQVIRNPAAPDGDRATARGTCKPRRRSATAGGRPARRRRR